MKKLLTFLALTSFTAAFSQITINGNFPASMSSGSSIDVEVKINKGTVGNFAKYQMDVPAGITVSAAEVKGGNFTFENQRAKIVWVSVPSDPEFTIKFKVMAGSDAPASATLSQKFYYLENNEKKEVEATAVVISISGGSSVAASTPAATTPTPTETKPVEPVATPTPVETKPVETKAVEPVAVSTPVETKPTETKPVEPVVKSTPVETKPAETKPVEAAPVKKTTSSSPSEAGMTFKVQIGAFSSQPNKGKYSGLSNLSIDMINGMYKVTVGKFNSKDDAIKYRDELQSKGFSGFIAKYKDGVRVN